MAVPDSIRVLIVDDEAPARQRIADLLQRFLKRATASPPSP